MGFNLRWVELHEVQFNWGKVARGSSCMRTYLNGAELKGGSLALRFSDTRLELHVG